MTLVDERAEALTLRGGCLCPESARFVVGVGVGVDAFPLVDALAVHGIVVDTNPMPSEVGAELVRRLSGSTHGTLLRWEELCPPLIVGGGTGLESDVTSQAPGNGRNRAGARSRWRTSIDAQLPGLRYVYLTCRGRASDVDARRKDWGWIGLFAWTRARSLTIAVEDLDRDPAGTVRRLLVFLGVEHAEPHPVCPTAQQHRDASPPRAAAADSKKPVAGVAHHLPAVSIIVVSHNEGENLPLTVAGIRATVPDEVEIIVVDDWSTDDSLDALADVPHSGARVVRPDARGGVTGARNAGAGVAAGDVLVFADAHVDPSIGWLEALCAVLSDRSVACATTTVTQIHDRGSRGQGFTWREPQLRMRWLRSGGIRPQEVPFICGCLMAFRRDDFEQVGGFDSGLVRWGSEDAEIGLHLWRRGRASVVVPQATVAHLFRPSGNYEVPSELVVHNTLRLATTHLPATALAKVIDSMATLPTFVPAYRRLLDSDVWERRERVASESRHDGAWFLDRFRIRALQ